MISAEVAAALAAFGFAGMFIVARKDLLRNPVHSVVSVTLTVGALTTALATGIDYILTSQGVRMSWSDASLFLLGGVIGPGIAMPAAMKSVRVLGASIGVSLQQSARPLLSILGAVMIFGEGVTAIRWLGIAIVVCGGSLLALQSPAADRESKLLSSPGRRPVAGIQYPALAAVGFAGFDLVSKAGLNRGTSFSATAAVGLFASSLLWAPFALSRPGAMWQHVCLSKYSLASGVLFGLAILLAFYALQNGKVVIVSALFATQPLMVLVLAAVFLRDLERLSFRTVVLGIMVVCGTWLLVA